MTCYCISSPNTRCILNPYTVLIRPVIMFLVQTPVVIDCQDTVLIRPVTISSANTIYLGFIWLDIASPTNYFSHVIFQYTISGWFTIPGHSSVSNSNLSSPSTIYTKYLVKNDYRITWKYFTIKQTFICSECIIKVQMSTGLTPPQKNWVLNRIHTAENWVSR